MVVVLYVQSMKIYFRFGGRTGTGVDYYSRLRLISNTLIHVDVVKFIDGIVVGGVGQRIVRT